MKISEENLPRCFSLSTSEKSNCEFRKDTLVVTVGLFASSNVEPVELLLDIVWFRDLLVVICVVESVAAFDEGVFTKPQFH